MKQRNLKPAVPKRPDPERFVHAKTSRVDYSSGSFKVWNLRTPVLDGQDISRGTFISSHTEPSPSYRNF